MFTPVQQRGREDILRVEERPVRSLAGKLECANCGARLDIRAEDAVVFDGSGGQPHVRVIVVNDTEVVTLVNGIEVHRCAVPDAPSDG